MQGCAHFDQNLSNMFRRCFGPRNHTFWDSVSYSTSFLAPQRSPQRSQQGRSYRSHQGRHPRRRIRRRDRCCYLLHHAHHGTPLSRHPLCPPVRRAHHQLHAHPRHARCTPDPPRGRDGEGKLLPDDHLRDRASSRELRAGE